ncbi:MAG: 4-hydroxy-3-methylbut-2-enyl diphosphate reductase [Acidobacteria bacterium]|nr:MAG: 4-hydroxy-3-methylbut-2-enyl diphosphate reductase [Acidobacteriota bacterium]
MLRPAAQEDGVGHDPLIRKGFGLRKEVAPELARDYHSDLVARARLSGGELRFPGLTVRIAKEFGFCYGVERAVDYAYETRMKFPERRLFLTSEIIHNPRVNRRLRQIGFEFLDGSYGSRHGWEDLTPEDVVLIPAFGVTAEELARLRRIGCLLVDTTCGSVLNVWRRVERCARDGFTCLIHGKHEHEETRATASRALVHPGGRYLVVRDLDETEIVARYIERGGDRDAFARRFAKAMSPGFDPDRDLERIGMANQTTMLSSESLKVQERIRRALAARYGEEALGEHFRAFDTICSATQDRQDAIRQMMERPPDLALIIGGFNSSNTGHLTEICGASCPSYHVESADDLLDARRIRHLPVGGHEPVVSRGWLPERPIEIGITAGASTPDQEVGRVIDRVVALSGCEPEPESSPGPLR